VFFKRQSYRRHEIMLAPDVIAVALSAAVQSKSSAPLRSVSLASQQESPSNRIGFGSWIYGRFSSWSKTQRSMPQLAAGDSARLIEDKPVDEAQQKYASAGRSAQVKGPDSVLPVSHPKGRRRNQSRLPLYAWIQAGQVNRPIRVLPVDLELPNYGWVRLLCDFQDS
jgi:hypothetical protein